MEEGCIGIEEDPSNLDVENGENGIEKEIVSDDLVFTTLAYSYLEAMTVRRNKFGLLGFYKFASVDDPERTLDIHREYASKKVKELIEIDNNSKKKEPAKIDYMEYVLEIMALNSLTEMLWFREEGVDISVFEEITGCEPTKENLERYRNEALQRVIKIGKIIKNEFSEDKIYNASPTKCHSYYLRRGLIGTPDIFWGDMEQRHRMDETKYSEDSIINKYADLKKCEKEKQKIEELYESSKGLVEIEKKKGSVRIRRLLLIEEDMRVLFHGHLQSLQKAIESAEKEYHSFVRDKFDNINDIIHVHELYGIPLGKEFQEKVNDLKQIGFVVDGIYGKKYDFSKVDEYYSQKYKEKVQEKTDETNQENV